MFIGSQSFKPNTAQQFLDSISLITFLIKRIDFLLQFQFNLLSYAIRGGRRKRWGATHIWSLFNLHVFNKCWFNWYTFPGTQLNAEDVPIRDIIPVLKISQIERIKKEHSCVTFNNAVWKFPKYRSSSTYGGVTSQ